MLEIQKRTKPRLHPQLGTPVPAREDDDRNRVTHACATPPNEFSVPGPCCIANTPIRSPLVTRDTASAIWIPVRSCRTTIVRISASAAASISGFTGYPIRNPTPSRPVPQRLRQQHACDSPPLRPGNANDPGILAEPTRAGGGDPPGRARSVRPHRNRHRTDPQLRRTRTPSGYDTRTHSCVDRAAVS
jgi:hypothetical protein